MKVEVWSDFACPFCYIGKRRFEEALQQFYHKEKVSVVFKSFQLDPYAEKNQTESVHNMLAKKYNMPIEQAKAMNQQITEQAKEVGLDYCLDTMILTNTFAAHRISHYAKTKGKMDQMVERLLKAYFTDSLHIADYEVLIQLASEIGLDEQEVRQVLTDGDFTKEVQNDQQEARQIGVQGVPFFVFNRKYAVSGAQDSNAFLNVLERVWEEEQQQQPLQVLQDKQDAKGKSCTEESCEL
ncbi:MAG: DsbA family protein [Bacillus sp. (in: firmicutes)]